MPTLEVREYTPARLHALTPYLATDDPARAIEWYTEVFGAKLIDDPIVMPDGTHRPRRDCASATACSSSPANFPTNNT